MPTSEIALGHTPVSKWSESQGTARFTANCMRLLLAAGYWIARLSLLAVVGCFFLVFGMSMLLSWEISLAAAGLLCGHSVASLCTSDIGASCPPCSCSSSSLPHASRASHHTPRVTEGATRVQGPGVPRTRPSWSRLFFIFAHAASITISASL